MTGFGAIHYLSRFFNGYQHKAGHFEQAAVALHRAAARSAIHRRSRRSGIARGLLLRRLRRGLVEDLRRRNVLGEHLGRLFRDLLRWGSRSCRIGPQRRLCRAWARHACGWMAPMATACIGVPTPAKTWTNVGLRDTRHIARVRIHPENPDLVYVAALGHAFGSASRIGACSVRPTAARRGRRFWPPATRSGP